MSGKAQWHTPLCVMRNLQETWQKLENSGWAPPQGLDTSKPISYFNNPSKRQRTTAEYDLFFAYTKVFPLWDQKKAKDNCQNLGDVRENIYEQEKNKTVPLLTSFTYGLPARTPLDMPEIGFRRIRATADFSRRRGVMKVKEKQPQ